MVATQRCERMLQTLAHELRNPLASLQGCAYTLLESFDDLSPPLRRQLVEVVVNQSKRLDWLIGAVAAAGGGIPPRKIGRVEVSRVVADATRDASAAGVVGGSSTFIGDETRIRLAVEALCLALLAGGREGSIVLAGDELEIRSPLPAVGANRKWKVTLARRLLREEGCLVSIRKVSEGLKATIRFPCAEKESRRIA